LTHHTNATAESDQQQDMNQRPEQPGDKSREATLTKLRHGSMVSDRRHGSAVVISKRLARFTAQITKDIRSRDLALLHCRRGKTGNFHTVGVRHGGHVTNHENLAVTWQ